MPMFVSVLPNPDFEADGDLVLLDGKGGILIKYGRTLHTRSRGSKEGKGSIRSAITQSFAVVLLYTLGEDVD